MVWASHFNIAGMVVGLETAPTTGQKHLQGYIEFTKKVRPIGVMSEKLPGAHWEVARGNRAQNVAYCTKEGTWGCYGVVQAPEVIRTITELRPWQQEVVDLVSGEPDERSIHWYWEAAGGVGKSSLVKYLCVHHDALMTAGKAADMKQGILQWMEKKGRAPKIVIMDCPRSVLDYVSYSGLEEIKNGCFYASKYEGGMCVFNNPHVLVFGNQEPDRSKWSTDRIVTHDINPLPPREPGYAYGFNGQ